MTEEESEFRTGDGRRSFTGDGALAARKQGARAENDEHAMRGMLQY
jgi:hypothetical protein